MCQKSELTAREQFDSNSKSKGMFSEFFNWNWKVVEGRKGKKKIEREREKLFSSLLTFLRSSRGIPSTLRCTWIVSSSKNPSLSSCSSAKAACASSLSLSLSLSLSRERRLFSSSSSFLPFFFFFFFFFLQREEWLTMEFLLFSLSRPSSSAASKKKIREREEEKKFPDKSGNVQTEIFKK